MAAMAAELQTFKAQNPPIKPLNRKVYSRCYREAGNLYRGTVAPRGVNCVVVALPQFANQLELAYATQEGNCWPMRRRRFICFGGGEI
jgi:hypothetical protein